MISAGNIWSGSKFLAWLTAPTVLALRKGNLRTEFPIMYEGREFADVEAAYQITKKDGEWLSTQQLFDLMTKLLVIRFLAYPKTVEFLRGLGGIDFLVECEHRIYAYRNPWIGKGRGSGYIRCLIAAYEEVEKASRAAVEPDTQCIAITRNGKGSRCRNKRKGDKHLCGPHLDMLVRNHRVSVDVKYDRELFATALYDDERARAKAA